MQEASLTYRIRGCVFEVSKQLGSGFLENVYENALAIELKQNGLDIETQKPIKVFYKEKLVGNYITDIIVEGRILLELKATNEIHPKHKAQILNYLKATGIKVGLLINFTHPKAIIERYVV
jgi:GxxExxY protein